MDAAEARTADTQAGTRAWIASWQPHLSRAERRVSDVILNDPWAAIHSSISTIARRAGVSDPMVLRFCRALGYRGFVDFKLAVAAGFNPVEGSNPDELRSPQGRRRLWEPVVSVVTRGLQLMHQRADDAAIESAARWLSQASRVEFVGLDETATLYELLRQGSMRCGVAVSEVRAHELSGGLDWAPHGGGVTLLALVDAPGDAGQRAVEAALQRNAHTVAIAPATRVPAGPAVLTLDTGPVAPGRGLSRAAGLVNHLVAVQVLIDCLRRQKAEAPSTKLTKSLACQ